MLGYQDIRMNIRILCSDNRICVRIVRYMLGYVDMRSVLNSLMFVGE